MEVRSDREAEGSRRAGSLPRSVLMTAIAALVLAAATASRAAPGGGGTDGGQRVAIDRLLDDYTGLYAGDTLDRWATLFHPALSVAWPEADGTIRVRDLAGFLERQRGYFASGRRISERLENVRVDPGRRMARVSADFVLIDEGVERRGRLGLHLLQEGDAWKIVAILFSYDAGER